MLKDLKNSIKKILLVHSSNDLYGASKVLISLIEIFIKKGYEIHLILPCDGPLMHDNIIKQTKINIVKLGVFRKKYFNFFGLINRLFFIIKSTTFIKNYINKYDIDFIYVNTSTIISPLIASKITKKNNLCHIHEIPSKSKIYSKFIAFFLNFFSENIVLVSNSVNNFWLKKGLDKRKIKIVYNGFNFNSTIKKKTKNKKIIFTSISRIIPYKGHLLLLDIFEKLTLKNDNIYLQIIGDTLPYYQDYLDQLKLNVKNKGLNHKITFMGFKDDILPILSTSSFFIHTPISPDPLPTVVIEAIKTRTPVITNNLGGAYEILDNGKNGLIINNKSVDESVKKILDYLNHKQKQERIVNNAYNYVCENFTIEKFKLNILEIIE